MVNFVGEWIQWYEAELDKNGEFLFPDDLIVYTDYTAPTQAINTSYNDGAIITDPTITFQWTASIDTGVGIAGYLLYISLDPSFIWISPVLVNNTSISFNSTNLPLGTLFYKIIALDYLGQASSTQVHYISNQMTSLLPIIGGQWWNWWPSSSNNTQIDIQNKTWDYQNNNEQSIIDIIDTRLENLLQSNLDQGDARVTRIIEYDPEKNHSVAPVVLLEELIPNIGQIIGQLEVIDTQVSQTQDTEDESQSDQNIENQLEDRINLDDKNNELNEISDNQNNNSNSQADRSSNLKPYLLEKYRENQSVNWIPPDLLEEFNLDRSEIRPLNKSDIRRFLENNKKSLTEYLTIENIMLIMIVSILSYYLFILQWWWKNFSP